MNLFKIKAVYIVDDDAIVRMIATKIFKNITFQNPVYCFENGKDAIDDIAKKATENYFDNLNQKVLLLLDINMPIMDAWGFLDEFRDLDPAVKGHFLISIISSSIDSTDKFRGYSYPEVADFITKPLSGEDLLKFLKKHNLYEE